MYERAQDAVQQAFLLAWRELPRLRDVERLRRWLHRLLVNACYEEYRRHRRWTSADPGAAGRRTGQRRPDGLGRRP